MGRFNLAAAAALSVLAMLGAGERAAANTVTFNGISDYDTVMLSGGKTRLLLMPGPFAAKMPFSR